MASEERVRLFVALELPRNVSDALVSWRDGILANVDGLRAVSGESLHVTLCFLGWRDRGQIAPIATACGSVRAARAVPLSLSAAMWLPPRRPRVLAVGLDDPGAALSEVQSRLARELQAGGWYVPESRPFLSHVTVARGGRRERVHAVSLPPVPSLRFDGSQLTLYRSRLTPGGAEYESLASVSLAGVGSS